MSKFNSVWQAYCLSYCITVIYCSLMLMAGTKKWAHSAHLLQLYTHPALVTYRCTLFLICTEHVVATRQINRPCVTPAIFRRNNLLSFYLCLLQQKSIFTAGLSRFHQFIPCLLGEGLEIFNRTWVGRDNPQGLASSQCVERFFGAKNR